MPGWWKTPLKELPATYNARAESVTDKPMFRSAFKDRRCIIPASGFYEWTGDRANRQPHLFTAADGAPVLALAGLWARWRDPVSAEEVQSATIIVCSASAWMEKYHDGMPVILHPADFDGWLNGRLRAEALKCAPEATLRGWPVSPRLNRTGAGDDDPSVIEPTAALT